MGVTAQTVEPLVGVGLIVTESLSSCIACLAAAERDAIVRAIA
jgi:hypothetical protein